MVHSECLDTKLLAESARLICEAFAAGNPLRLAKLESKLEPETCARICIALVLNPGSPPEALAYVAKNAEHVYFLERSAENPSTPVDALILLSEHHEPLVRVALARNSNATSELLERLVTDDHADVRYAVAENHNAAADILTLLCDDDNPYVSHRARRTIAILETNRSYVPNILSPASPKPGTM